MANNSKPRISAIEFGRAKALGNARKAADIAMEGRDNILLLVVPDRTSKMFKIVASYGNETRIEHPLPWYVPFGVMLEECTSLAKAIEVERELETQRKQEVKRRPKL